MSLRRDAAIGHGIKESLAPIPGGVHADRKPDISGAPQGERGNQTESTRPSAPNVASPELPR